MIVSQDIALTVLDMLAARSPERVTAHEMVENTGMSIATMRNLVLPKLIKAGFIRPIHKTGYELARPADEIPVAEVLALFETDRGEGYSRSSAAALRILATAFDGVTVADVAGLR